jgi:predicted nucleic-acid-binding Zn-ribbon protein
MKNGICPKCKSKDIYYTYYGDKIKMPGYLAGEKHLEINLILAGFKTARTWMETYLCKDCGYVESYAHELDKLSQLDNAINWIKAKPD